MKLNIKPELVQVNEPRTHTHRPTLRAVWGEQRVRFLLSDGSTVDVLTTRDDSQLREAILKATLVERIINQAVIEDAE